VPVAYPGAQTAGDLNVVIVGWNDTAGRVSSVKDSSGNTYTLAIGPTQVSNTLSQSIYYAANIKANSSNTVTVTFSPAASYPDVRILEYSGIATANPIDVVAGSQESLNATSATGTVTTTSPLDLLVAGNTVSGYTQSPDPTFTQRLESQPDGNIAEDRVVTATGFVSASADLGGGGSWVMQLVAFRAAYQPGPDTTPPTVNITAPAAGKTLSGTTTVSVSASDTGTGVAGVQLQVDGMTLGTAVTTSPYTFTLNTAKFANGTHSLTAIAHDFANNSATTGPISVTFSNSSPGNPAQSGVWSGTFPLPIVSVNSILMPTGKILMYDGQSSFGCTAIAWDPIANTVDWAPVPSNIFCTGNEVMADGRVIIVGGHIASHAGLPNANIFDPSTETWTALPNMSYARWYPTATMNSDGTIIVTSGETNCEGCDAPVQEVYNSSTNSWSQLSGAPFTFPYYPAVYVLPTGSLLVAGTSENAIVSQLLNLNTLTWSSIGGSAVDGGSSVMYLPGKFLKTGKSIDPDLATVPSLASAYVLDTTVSSPSWGKNPIPAMHFARAFHNMTLLPDGTVLVTGGGTTTNPTGVSGAVLPAELWSPTAQSWTVLASMSAPRLYHSEALLLPDARVLISGGGRFNDDTESTDQFSVEFFAPPYLFNGPLPAIRPTISSAPSQLFYAQNFTVQTPNAAQIASVSLIRFGAVTHAFNAGQRFLPLAFSAGSGSLTVTAPANSDLAPAGYYMLFIVNTSGVPSVAAIVHF
jgi:hypothetical protein